jgi:hypothetical protein
MEVNMKHTVTVAQRILALLSSRHFFWGVVGLLIIQALWVALTAHYPMAFDEDFHLGIIRIYAHHLSPFLSGQPAGADVYGAISRDPSYLYQYLLSFPYRLISVFTHDQTIIVIGLRCLNIGLFVSGLILYRRLLRSLRAPDGVINGCLLFFVLIPVVPLLAGQINYDNLFIPGLVLCLLLSVKLTVVLRAQQRLDFRLFVLLIVACLMTSLVKYAFLPVFLAIGLLSAFQVWLITGWSIRRVVELFRVSVRAMTGRLLLGYGLLLLIAVGLFSQRYLVNIIQYGTPIPDCGKVLSVKQCSSYGPWIRDYNFKINKLDEDKNPLVFTEDWLYGMWLRLYFSVDGPATQYQTRGPLPVPALSAIVYAGGGLVVLIFGARRLWRTYDRSTVALFGVAAFIYGLTIYLDNYKAYLRTGQPVAINGRYLLPFIPIVLVLVCLAGRSYLRKYPRLSSLLIVSILFTQIWGGGVLTYILRSNDDWYWSAPAAHSATHSVQHLLEPVIPGYNEPTEFLK